MPDNDIDLPSAAALHPFEALRFLVESGADEAIGLEPLDRTAMPVLSPQAGNTQARPAPGAGARAETPKAAAPLRAPPPAAPIRPSAALLSAQANESAAAKAAAACETIEQLEAAVRAFEGCALKTTATNTVFARGNSKAPLLIMGEAPGREEDQRGQPFVGESGRLLDLMLKAIGRDESNAYISNVIFWRPPGNRDPSPEELQACRPFVERHIALVRPRVIFCVGRFAVSTLLDTTQGITRIRGKWHEYNRGDLTIPALPSFHPAYLLRQPGLKRDAWRDLLNLQARLEELGA